MQEDPPVSRLEPAQDSLLNCELHHPTASDAMQS